MLLQAHRKKTQRKTKKCSKRQLLKLPAANETGVDPAAAAGLSIPEGIFALKEERKTELKAFLGRKM